MVEAEKSDLDADLLREVDSTEPVALTEPEGGADPRPDTTSDEPAPRPGPAPVQRDAPARSGFVPALLGGAIAAALGFGLSHFDVLNLPPDADTLALEAQITAQATETSALRDTFAAQPAPDPTLSDRVAALEAAPAPEPAPAVDLAPLEEAFAASEKAIAAMESRISTLEQMPVGGDGVSPAALAAQTAALNALRADVEALKGSGTGIAAEIEAMAAEAQARVAEAEASAETLRAEAEALASAASARAALGRVQAALDTGMPFGAALTDLSGVEIPAVLIEAAEGGLPTLTMLRDTFPGAARAALEVSLQADMGDGWADRIGSFLRTTTGARSLTPREGDDPDAVLSRAEAALALGDIAGAVTELAVLPPEGQAAMAAWVGQANRRLTAAEAVVALAATLGQ